MKLKNWIRRSFRNRIFATILVVTLMPLLLCDVVMMRVIGALLYKPMGKHMTCQLLKKQKA